MDLRSLLTRHRARLLSDLPHHWGSQPTGGECHLSLDAHYGPKQKKKNGIVELYMSMVAEVGADHVAAHHQKKYQGRSEEHTSELQSRLHLVCRLLLEKKKT